MGTRFSAIVGAFIGVSLFSLDVIASERSTLPEVTVTAPKPPTENQLAGSAVDDFVLARAKPAVATGQISRWRDPICPTTAGLSPEFNDFISARVLAIASLVGAPHNDRKNCKTNIEIVFSIHPQDMMDRAMKKNSSVLGYHYPHQTEKLSTVTKPIQGWYMTVTRGGAKGDVSLDEAIPILQPPPQMGLYSQTPVGEAGSHLGNDNTSEIVNALIIIDATKIVNRAVGMLSDYIAMIALTQTTQPNLCSQLPTIMDSFVDGCIEKNELTEITAGDLAFLRGLYRANLGLYLSLERDDIKDNMKRQFKTH